MLQFDKIREAWYGKEEDKKEEVIEEPTPEPSPVTPAPAPTPAPVHPPKPLPAALTAYDVLGYMSNMFTGIPMMRVHIPSVLSSLTQGE